MQSSSPWLLLNAMFRHVCKSSCNFNCKILQEMHSTRGGYFDLNGESVIPLITAKTRSEDLFVHGSRQNTCQRVFAMFINH